MIHDFLYRLRVLLRRARTENDLDDELQFHLAKQAEQHMRRGVPPREASRKARMELGGVTQVKEETRQSWGISLAECLWSDARFAIRELIKSPVFTVAIVLSLGLGIGANTAIFTLMDAVMWRLLPVKDPEHLLVASVFQDGATQQFGGFTYSQYEQMRNNAERSYLAGYTTAPINISIDGPAEPTVQGQLVTGDYFSLLGVTPTLGRSLGPEDDQTPNGHPVAMLSYNYWEKRFARDPAVIGKTIRLSAMPFTIVGVTPPEFFGVELGASPDLFLPIMMQPTVMPAFENLLQNPIVIRPWVQTIARVRDGSTAKEASAELTALIRTEMEPMRSRGLRVPENLRIELRPATELSQLRQRFSNVLLVLFGMVGILLLIACSNTANLLLARAAARRPEFAMRLALGAGRRRLTSQLLVESIVLASLGGLFGILLAQWATRALIVFVSIGRTPVTFDLSPNPRILMFTVAVSVLTGVLFGIVPAIRASRVDLVPALRNVGGMLNGSRGRLRPGRILTGLQIVLSLVLLVGAGLSVRSLQTLNGNSAVEERDNVFVMRVEPRGSDQRNIPGTSERLDRTYRQLIERVRQIPGVQTVSMANSSPVTPVSSAGARVSTPTGEQRGVPILMAYPEYFTAVRMALVEGRDFDVNDLRDDAPVVCLVNETFAREFFPGEDAIGKPCTSAYRQNTTSLEPVEIVGVVHDSRYTNPQRETLPLIYMTFPQTNTGRGQMLLYVRAANESVPIRQRIREAVMAVDPTMPMFAIHTLAEEMDAALVQQRLLALLASLFGGVALLLSSVGLYGLLAFGVVQRTSEIGIRMAMGARRGNVIWLVLRDALLVADGGLLVGIPVAIAVARVAESRVSGLLFGLKATDPQTLIGSVIVLIGVAMTAALLPALRAAHVDPLVALREE